MRLHDYINDIWDIAKANDKPVDIGCDLFLTNVRQGKDFYKGAKGINWAALKPRLRELEDSRESYDKAVIQHYKALCGLRAEGKRKAAAELLR